MNETESRSASFFQALREDYGVGGAGPGPSPGDGVGPDVIGRGVFDPRLLAKERTTPATMAIATTASIANPTGDTRNARKLFGRGWT